MYLQICNYCQLRCEHCCYNCGPDGKQFMSLEVFKRSLKHAADYDDHISIGGGEPTTHPDFWAMIGYALGHSDQVWLATNGLETETALTLAKLARKGVLGVALSMDEYHQPPDRKVIEAFTNNKTTGYNRSSDVDLREVRTVKRISALGRGANITGAVDDCCCEDMLIDPKGMVWACGCKNKALGHITGRGAATKYSNLRYRMQELETECWTKFYAKQKETRSRA